METRSDMAALRENHQRIMAIELAKCRAGRLGLQRLARQFPGADLPAIHGPLVSSDGAGNCGP